MGYVRVSLEEAMQAVIDRFGALPPWFHVDYCFVTIDVRWKLNSRGMRDYILVGRTAEGEWDIRQNAPLRGPMPARGEGR